MRRELESAPRLRDRRGMRIRFALLVALIFSVTPIVPSGAADRGDRFALVIGNSKYPDAEAPLKEPINDARDIGDELKRNGFNIELGENLTGDAMRRAFARLYSRIKPGSVALIFFSGFGVQSNRQSFMIPVDAQIWTESDVRRDGFSIETILAEDNAPLPLLADRPDSIVHVKNWKPFIFIEIFSRVANVLPHDRYPSSTTWIDGTNFFVNHTDRI